MVVVCGRMSTLTHYYPSLLASNSEDEQGMLQVEGLKNRLVSAWFSAHTPTPAGKMWAGKVNETHSQFPVTAVEFMSNNLQLLCG